jgi:hypothetical protein
VGWRAYPLGVSEWSPAEAGAQYLAYGITVAEGKPEKVPVQEFRAARDRMLSDPVARRTAPPFIARCSTPDLLWGYLRSKATGTGSWGIRRGVMHEAVDPILDALAGATVGPTDELVSGAVTRLNSDSVRDAWTRAVERRDSEPDAAVTAARSLLESTLKTILDDHGEPYDEGDDLPKLYRRVQDVLRLSPAEQTEDRFRAILGACSTIVKELGSVRNRHSDAHGEGRKRYRVEGRHAALAVNLAGAMALFLIETHEARQDDD